MTARHVALATSVLVGCGGPPTSELTPYFNVRLEGSQLGVSAAFPGESLGELIELDDGDRMIVRFRERTVPLQPHGQEYFTWIELESDLVADEPISFVLSRDGESDVTTTILVAPPIVLDEFPLFISRSEDTTFSWSPASEDMMAWDVRSSRGASCISSSDGDIPPGATMAVIPGQPGNYLEDICTAEFTLIRFREADIDPAFAGGTIQFTHFIAMPFASTP